MLMILFMTNHLDAVLINLNHGREYSLSQEPGLSPLGSTFTLQHSALYTHSQPMQSLSIIMIMNSKYFDKLALDEFLISPILKF